MFVYYCRDSRGSLEPIVILGHIDEDCLPILDVWMNLNTRIYVK